MLPTLTTPSPYQHSFTRGMSFVDVIVGVALAALIFSGLFGAFKLSIELISLSKARSGALALANERMEYLRNLPYTSVGTVGGIPSGPAAQTETISLNRTVYTRRTLIVYTDDARDGVGAGDQNGITTDYKKAKVELTWTHRGQVESMFLATNIVPKGMETIVNGGTLRINVVDALNAPLSGASVRVVNPSTSPAINTASYGNAAGQAILGGAPVSSNYQITVSKEDMSTSTTYAASTTNPNPNPRHLTVANQQTTTATFATDYLASKTVWTVLPITLASTTDTFTDTSGLATLASTSVSAGSVRLLDFAGVYEPSGNAQSTAISPTYLSSWQSLSFSRAVPSGTDARIRLMYDPGSGYVPIPDSDLPGNAAGFVSSPVSLVSLSTTTYPVVALSATFTTTNPAQSPSVADWAITYERGPVPAPNIAFSMRGAKTIGTASGGASIYKYNASSTSDSSGSRSFPILEWDSYTITLPGSAYDIAEACPPQPKALAPSEAATTLIHIVPNSARSIRVVVHNASGQYLSDATALLTRTGYSQSRTTRVCGQGFFENLAAATNYQLRVGKPGYATSTQTVNVSTDHVIDVLLN